MWLQTPLYMIFFYFLPPGGGCSETEITITEARPLIGLLYKPRMMVDNECGAIRGKFGKENQRTRSKPAPVPLCLPQIPHDLTWVAMVGNQQLTS
jgi:hypothetical protein